MIRPVQRRELAVKAVAMKNVSVALAVIASQSAIFRRCYGPEYISGTLMEWAEDGITLAHIQPGKPQQNANVERYNRTVRYEWLDLSIFESIEEVQKIATEWLWSYNNERPNIGNGGMTPAQKLRVAA